MTAISKEVKATFDTETKEGKIRIFNAKQSSGVSLKTLQSGQGIEVEAVLQYQDVTEEFGQPQEVTITVLYGTDGVLYSSVSNSVADAGANLIDLFADLGVDSLPVTIQRNKSKSDRDFITLSIG